MSRLQEAGRLHEALKDDPATTMRRAGMALVLELYLSPEAICHCLVHIIRPQAP